MAEGLLVQEYDGESESTQQSQTQCFDHPVYREISKTNGQINKMKEAEVKRCLQELGLDFRSAEYKENNITLLKCVCLKQDEKILF